MPKPEWSNGVQFFPGTQVKSFSYIALPHGNEDISDGRFNVSSSITPTINKAYAFDYFGGYKLNGSHFSLYQRPAHFIDSYYGKHHNTKHLIEDLILVKYSCFIIFQ